MRSLQFEHIIKTSDAPHSGQNFDSTGIRSLQFEHVIRTSEGSDDALSTWTSFCGVVSFVEEVGPRIPLINKKPNALTAIADLIGGPEGLLSGFVNKKIPPKTSTNPKTF